MLLIDFCNHQRRHEHPRNVRLSSAAAHTADNPRSTRQAPRGSRAWQCPDGAARRVRANPNRPMRPRMTTRLTTRRQLRLCSHRVPTRAAPRRACPPPRRCRPRSESRDAASDVLVARRALESIAPDGLRRARTGSLTLASTRTNYLGPERLPSTRRPPFYVVHHDEKRYPPPIP